MENMTIYRKVNGADTQMLNESKLENVWGHQMLVRTVDKSDKELASQLKADGWQPDPQSVIDEVEGEQLQAENARLQRQIDSAKAIERVAELEAENDRLKAENAELKKPKTATKTTAKTETAAAK